MFRIDALNLIVGHDAVGCEEKLCGTIISQVLGYDTDTELGRELSNYINTLQARYL